MVGENVHINNLPGPPEVPVIPNIEEALNDWFNEHQNYGFEPYSLTTERPIGHYTQVFFSTVARSHMRTKEKNCKEIASNIFSYIHTYVTHAFQKVVDRAHVCIHICRKRWSIRS